MAKVLVVDDEQDIRFYLRLVFEMAGHEVMEAIHGGAALEIVGGDLPDLVVTDLMMPVLDGNKLIEGLRADPYTAGIPILSLTANPEASVGADAVLDKLPPATEILAAATSLLEGRR